MFSTVHKLDMGWFLVSIQRKCEMARLWEQNYMILLGQKKEKLSSVCCIFTGTIFGRKDVAGECSGKAQNEELYTDQGGLFPWTTCCILFYRKAKDLFFFLLLFLQPKTSILPLTIETGRFQNTPEEDRLCEMCDLNDVESESHFLLYCTPLWWFKRASL